MPTNFYFQAGIPGGRSSEQLLMENIIIECLKIYGFDIYYLPRETVNLDTVLNEDPLNKYNSAYPIEMYLSNVDGFSGEGDLLTKFGVEIRDTATFIVSKRRWDELIARSGTAQITIRPAEGDVLYFPLTKSYFEIRRVEAKDPFFQVGKLYVYKLECELMVYSSETFDTGVEEIDSQVVDKSASITDYELLLESGDALLLEYETASSLILETYNQASKDNESQNDIFSQYIDILDFTEINPFGEIRA